MSDHRRRSSASLPALLAAANTPRTVLAAHARILTAGAEQDVYLATLLVARYNAVLRRHPHALLAFTRFRRPNVNLWNAALKSYSLAGDGGAALPLAAFNRMRRSQISPDRCSFPSLLKACAAAVALREGASLHCAVVKSGVAGDVFVQTSLVDLYGKCGETGSARKVFDTMRAPNIVSWTALMVAYIIAGDLETARKVFDEMPSRNVPALNAMINACAQGGDLVTARRLFDEMPERDVVSFTSMIVGYAKSGDMSSARWLFDQCERIDVVAWSAMISGYAQNGRPAEAIKIFFDFFYKVKADEFVLVSLMSACAQLGDKDLCNWVGSYLARSGLKLDQVHVVSALVDMNTKCGNMDESLDLFHRLPRRDLVVYCSIMQGLCIHGNGAKAVELFSQMLEEGVVPDKVAFTVVLTACSHAGLVEDGRRCFNRMKEYGHSPLPDHFACMVHLLGRAGLLNEAYELLQSTPVESHVGAWGALLGASWQHGDVELGELVAKRLFEIEPTNGGNYVLMSNLYAGYNQWCKVAEVREQMRERGVKKIIGCSYLSNVHQQLMRGCE